MKSVLLSIQAKWCELIVKGDKTIEVRKTKPKIDTPFKCYIYCTKDKNGWFDFEKKERLDGKIIGEFVCDDICEYMPYKWREGGFEGLNYMYNPTLCYESRLSQSEIIKYGNRGKVYGWHISDLVIYDKPKELSQFSVLDDKAIKECEHRERIYVNPDSVNGAWLKGSYICTKGEEDWCSKCKTKPIKRPPQSWCYVDHPTEKGGGEE